MTITLIPIAGIPEITEGDVIADTITAAAAAQATPLADGDCIVVTQKIVSKAEGRIVALDPERPTAKTDLVESESRRVLRRRGELLITETHHGYVCANAGIDLSNVAPGTAALLPVDPDRSAQRIRERLRATAGVDCAVIISDTFGRAWRRGLTDIALGVAGLVAILDLRGTADDRGRALAVTEIALADEVAGAAELVMGKAAGVPAAIVRGLDPAWLGDGRGRDLIRPPAEDLFR
jgi:coenzyme F420-0:L-glutamate ligase/coenzyme F420-1:gamma-L-glutamate ligase